MGVMPAPFVTILGFAKPNDHGRTGLNRVDAEHLEPGDVVQEAEQRPRGCRCGVRVVVGRRRFRFRRVVAIPTSGREESREPMSTAGQIALVVHTLGFGNRRLAEIFGVSRRAIYDWLRGGEG